MGSMRQLVSKALPKKVNKGWLALNTGTGGFTGAFNEALNNPNATPGSITGTAAVGASAAFVSNFGNQEVELRPLGNAPITSGAHFFLGGI